MSERKMWAQSKHRYKANAAERKLYGGATVTDFWVGYAGDERDASKWVVVRGFGPTSGQRKTDAMTKARRLLADKGAK